MDEEKLERIRFCAFCPNICRYYYPTFDSEQKESKASSALAYLCYALINKYMDYTRDAYSTLQQLDAAESCREACPYGYDIPQYIREFLKEKKDVFMR